MTKLFINTLNNKGPSMEPCGISRQTGRPKEGSFSHSHHI